MNCNKQSNQVPRNTTHKFFSTWEKLFGLWYCIKSSPFHIQGKQDFMYVYTCTVEGWTLVSAVTMAVAAAFTVSTLLCTLLMVESLLCKKKYKFLSFSGEPPAVRFTSDILSGCVRLKSMKESLEIFKRLAITHKETKKWSLYKWNLYWNIYLVPLYSLENKVLWSL